MSDYRIEAASKEEWAERALRAETENARLRKIFQSMDDTIVARSELFISDQECLLNLRDRIRRALETKGTRDEA